MDEARALFRSPVNVIGKGGKTLRMRPPHFGGVLKIRDFVRDKPLREILQQLEGAKLSTDPETDKALRLELIRDARDEGKRISAGIEKGQLVNAFEHLVSVDGIRVLVKILASEEHPDITDAEIAAFVDDSNIDEVVNQLGEVMTPDVGADPTKGSLTTRNLTRTDRKQLERSRKRSKR